MVSMLRILQGKEIDSIKTGVRWNIPKHMRNYLKKIPYFLIYNYPQKKNRYFKILEENKILPAESKKEKNAYHSPSQMNELCEYINKWEKQKLDWDRSVVNTMVLLIDGDLVLSDRKIVRRMEVINDEFYEELKEIFKSKSENYSTQIDLLMQKYKEILYSEFKDLDKNLMANYFIKASYGSIATNKLLCWGIFSDIMLENLKKNSPNQKSVKIVEGTQYEFLGKYYDMIEGDEK